MRLFPIYESNSTAFGSGASERLTYLDRVSKATVRRNVKGEYSASITLAYTPANQELIQNDRIIRLPVCPSDRAPIQGFRIHSFDIRYGSDKTIDIELDHVSYDANYMPTIAISKVSGASKAVTAISNAVVGGLSPFTITTNLSDISTAFESKKIRSLRSLIGDGEDSFMALFKCECDFNNFEMNLTKQIGLETNIQLVLLKNIVDCSEAYDYNDFRTAIFPYWTNSDGVSRWISTSSGVERLIPTSTETFKHQKYGLLDLSDKFDTDPTAQQLHDKAVEEIAKQSWGSPKVTIDLDAYVPFDHDSTGNLYSWRQAAIRIGDRFDYVNPYTHETKRVRMIEYEYDCLEDAYTSITIDTEYSKVSDTVSNLDATVSGLVESSTINRNWTNVGITTGGSGCINGTLVSGSKLEVNQAFGLARIHGKFTLGASLSGTYGTYRLGEIGIAYAPDLPMPIEMWVATGLNDSSIANASGSNTISYNAIKGVIHKLSGGDKAALSVYNYSGKTIPSGTSIYFNGTWPYYSK